METFSTDTELDWELDPEVVAARKRLRDVEGIHEQRERERQLLWDCQFSDDPFARARFRSEWPAVDGAAATAEAYWIQGRQRLARAEQEAKAKAQPLWDDKFRESWRVIEGVLTGPLMQAMTDWEGLAREASAKGMVIPVQLPANIMAESIPVWVQWIRGQLQLDAS